MARRLRKSRLIAHLRAIIQPYGRSPELITTTVQRTSSTFIAEVEQKSILWPGSALSNACRSAKAFLMHLVSLSRIIFGSDDPSCFSSSTLSSFRSIIHEPRLRLHYSLDCELSTDMLYGNAHLAISTNNSLDGSTDEDDKTYHIRHLSIRKRVRSLTKLGTPITCSLVHAEYRDEDYAEGRRKEG
ncbi:hypothetical protein M501DRAFT_1020347 [Patellaria atrata CBS 101060]|uniref:Uncharacterized protein n=1 Tax=Patellaria atrata CBS 101060 TaxID=1346257 RepID=A0A9P4VM89_9PEZI|nr:hypothetical protein M501DRAFT_1020347 [Patellaria atrata CBS 101060]